VQFTWEEIFTLNIVIAAITTLLWLYFYKKEIGFKPDFKFSFQNEVKPLLAYSGLGSLAILTNFFNSKIDIWFVEGYRGAGELGFYSVAIGLSGLLQMIPATLNIVLFPYLAKGNLETNAKNLKLFSKITVTTVLILAIAGLLTADFLVPALYGDNFSSSVEPYKILLVAMTFLGCRGVFSIYNFAANKIKYNLIANTVGVVFTIVLDIVLIPKYGIVGAAYASLAAYFVSSVFIVYSVLGLQKLPFGNYFFITIGDLRAVSLLIKKRLR
jgi:O-antigen/teichoic acid export membrane protein